MRFRLRKLLIGSLLIAGWALALAIVVSGWEEAWRYFREAPFPWE
jgi:hypothetical protein